MLLLKKQGRSAGNTPTPRASPSDMCYGHIAVFIAPQSGGSEEQTHFPVAHIPALP